MAITPAVLPENFDQIVDKLFLLEGICSRVQIDLCDGVSGLSKTWLPYKEIELPSGFEYEFDLMVVDWKKYLERVITLNAKRVVVHIDYFSDEDLEEMIQLVMSHKLTLGLAVSNTYDVTVFAQYINQIVRAYPKVFIQVMGIRHIGAQGQPFDLEVLKRIAYLRSACPQVSIQVDGSMNPETIALVRKEGAECAVVGSYLFGNGDIKKTLQKLESSFR